MGAAAVAGQAQQRTERRLHRGRERRRVVAALQEEGEAAGAGSELPHDPGQLGEVAARELELPERIGPVGVEPARNQHPVGSEVLDRASRHLVEGGAHHVARRAGRERHVEREAGSAGTPDLVRAARAGVQRVLVRRDVEDVGVVPEDRLGAVAVMHVPVHDQDPLSRRRA